MNRRLAILVTFLNLIFVASCQQASQPGTVISHLATISISQADGSTISSPTVASPATSTNAHELAATPISSPIPSDSSPLAITAMRAKTYPGSDLVIENTLSAGQGYNRYIVSYQSDGLKLFGLLTVPTSAKPAGGWPVILLNHGYIPLPSIRPTRVMPGLSLRWLRRVISCSSPIIAAMAVHQVFLLKSMYLQIMLLTA